MSSMNWWGPGGTPQPTGLLTRSQLAARQPGTNYQDYVHYVTRTRARRAAARQSQWQSALGPLAAVVPPPGYFQQQAQSLYPILGPEEIQRRTQTSISSQIDPILANLRATSGRETAAGMSQIQSYAQGAQASLAQIAPEVQKAYEEALGQQQGIDAGLSGLMGKAGKNAASSVGKALGGAHQVAGGAVGSISGMGAGAAAAEAGMGSASQSELVADQAAQMAYAAGLPGVASSQGQFDAGRFALNQQRSLADQIGSITSQIPGITQSLLQSYQDQNLESRKARAALIQGGWQSALTAAGTNLGLQMDQKRIDEALKEAQISSGTSITTANIGEAGANARNTASIQSAAQIQAMSDAADMAQLKYQVAHPTATAGTNPLSRLGIESGKIVQNVTKNMLNRRVRYGVHPELPIGAKLPQSLGGGINQEASSSKRTGGRPQPMANQRAYQLIYNSLYSQFGGTKPMDTPAQVQQNMGWYATQISAIAGRAGYARATPDRVVTALGAGPKPQAKTAAKPPVRTPQATAPRGKPQDAAATKQFGDQQREAAFRTFSDLFKRGVDKDKAIATVSNQLSSQMDYLTAMAVASRVADQVYPHAGPSKPATKPIATPSTSAPGLPKGTKFKSAVKAKDGTIYATDRGRSVWKFVNGRWHRVWSPP